MNSSIHAIKSTLLVFVSSLSLVGVAFAPDDVTSPLIAHVPVTTGTEGQRIAIEAVIIDDVAVAGATLHYRKIGDLTYSTTAMVLCEECVDVFEATIPASLVTTAGVDYYISATDGTNVATDPATDPESSPHVIAVEAALPMPPWMLLTALVLLVILTAAALIIVRKRGKKVPRKHVI